MRSSKSVVNFFLALLISVSADAAGPILDNLSQEDVEKIVQDFTRLSFHNPVTGSDAISNLGSSAADDDESSTDSEGIWRVQFSLKSGAAETPGVDRISKEINPANDFAILPFGEIGVAGQLAPGLQLQASFLPEIKIQSTELRSYAFAGQWRFTDRWSLPLSAAVRLRTARAKVSFTQSSPSPETRVDYFGKTDGYGFVLGKRYGRWEPFVGVNRVKTIGEIEATASIFNYTGARSEKAKVSGTSPYLGVAAQFGALQLALEGARLFDSEKLSFALALQF